jgi:hypothetical protein
MKEELISFETAKLARKKGFNWNTRRFYSPDGRVDITMYSKNHNRPMSENYAIPTQSLLQKWLREKYHLHIQIIEYDKDGSLIIQITKNSQLVYDYMTSFDINEYEEALEKGLQEALKLI